MIDPSDLLLASHQALHQAQETVQQAERRIMERRMTDKVECPFCGHFQSLVLPYHNTPADQLTGGFRRWRRCANPECASRFSTIERVDAA